MTDEPESHTLRYLRRIDQKLDRLDLKLTDLTDSVHRIEADLGALRGSVSSMRHDVNIFANRWSDLEVRMRAVEEEAAPNH
jgi:predicted  nucleic acid-binding Zn-ribbon protein